MRFVLFCVSLGRHGWFRTWDSLFAFLVVHFCLSDMAFTGGRIMGSDFWGGSIAAAYPEFSDCEPNMRWQAAGATYFVHL